MANTTLHAEFTCFATGTDCDAVTAWYKLDAAGDMATLRAAAHWAKASEEDADAVGRALGISQPFPDSEAWPRWFPRALCADYQAAFDRALQRLEVA